MMISIYFICTTCGEESDHYSNLISLTLNPTMPGVTTGEFKEVGMKAHAILNPEHDIRWDYRKGELHSDGNMDIPKGVLDEKCENCGNSGYEGSEGEGGEYCYAERLPEDQQPTRKKLGKKGFWSQGNPEDKMPYRPIRIDDQETCIWEPSEFIPGAHYKAEVWTPEYYQRRKRQITMEFGVKHINDD